MILILHIVLGQSASEDKSKIYVTTGTRDFSFANSVYTPSYVGFSIHLLADPHGMILYQAVSFVPLSGLACGDGSSISGGDGGGRCYGTRRLTRLSQRLIDTLSSCAAAAAVDRIDLLI